MTEYAPNWMRYLEPRELAQVYHAIAYEKDFKQAGVPGHNHLLLIARLAKLLDEITTLETMRNIKD